LNYKEIKRLIKLHNHKIGYCSNCGPEIDCGFCGNNCCNGGSGKLINGEIVPCPNHCKEAYEIQEYLDKNNKWPLSYRIRFYYQFVITLWFQKYIKVPVNNYFYRLKNDR
jgi:hypothetical protein